jgi:hypothetical protein
MTDLAVVKLGLCLVTSMMLAGCGSSPGTGLMGSGSSCEDGVGVRTELFFGLGKPDGGVVSEVEWESFVEEYITPRFRDGLTVVDANGQWVDKKGEITKEKTMIVILFHGGSEEAERSIEYIRDKYKRLFGQESVLRISMCAEVVY